jgi:hypothetical protein
VLDRNEAGQFRARTTTCHFDGYYDHMWPTLTKGYPTLDDVEKLIAEGEASFVGEEFEPGDGESCVFYARDRGEDLVEPIESPWFETEEELVDWLCERIHRIWAQYLYLFDSVAGVWRNFGED